jgi:hypothetical protein
VRPVSPALGLSERTGCRAASLGAAPSRESGAASTRSPNAGATSDQPLRTEGLRPFGIPRRIRSWCGLTAQRACRRPTASPCSPHARP